jgi:dihydroorotate dehydrogenase
VFDYYRLLWPALRRLEPERAHALAIALARVPRVARARGDEALRCWVWGRSFANPIGLAAGFDKNAQACAAMLRLGFGFVEVGTVTPEPQPGNPRPRVFRLEDDGALINRLGFNNDGVDRVALRLLRRASRPPCGIVGANVGPNRDAADPLADCARAVRTLAPLVDYVVVNVSSPNTPGLRALQRLEPLRALIGRVQRARDEAAAGVPLLVKLAPDLGPEDIAAIADLALETGLDGLIATNTTLERPAHLRAAARRQAGGLSGRPLFPRSTAVLATLFARTGGAIPLVGVGGVASGADAYAKIRAGASLVQLYTALVYRGPRLVGDIGRDLALLLRRDGFASVAEAVGRDARELAW